MSVVIAIFALLVAYQVKHFVADYPLQGKFMLRKFHRDPRVWVPALAAHAGVHALATALIASWALYFSQRLTTNVGAWNIIIGLAALDFVVHFAMDRLKASPDLLGRFKPLTGEEYAAAQQLASLAPCDDGCPSEMGRRRGLQRIRGNTYFWWALGFDQMVHHLTHYVIIFILLIAR